MWVARDEADVLCLYTHKPIRTENDKTIGNWWILPHEIEDSGEGEYIVIDPNLFPELRWEDEPIEVELRIKE